MNGEPPPRHGALRWLDVENLARRAFRCRENAERSSLAAASWQNSARSTHDYGPLPDRNLDLTIVRVQCDSTAEG